MKKKNCKHQFTAWGYSDDCGNMTGTHYPDGTEVDEYDGCHHWFELKLDGKVIGQAMMNYGDTGWEFLFRSNTHNLEAGKLLCRWDGSPYEPYDEE